MEESASGPLSSASLHRDTAGRSRVSQLDGGVSLRTALISITTQRHRWTVTSSHNLMEESASGPLSSASLHRDTAGRSRVSQLDGGVSLRTALISINTQRHRWTVTSSHNLMEESASGPLSSASLHRDTAGRSRVVTT